MPMRSITTAIHWQGMWTVSAWIAAGLLFAVLLLGDRSAPWSPYWASELVLYGLLLGGMWVNHRYGLKKKLPIPRRIAPLAYVFLVWLFGMLFEISLTVTGEGVGGLHAQTLPSFILAQGDYIPIGVISYLVIRRTQASFRDVFFFAGGKSLTEGLIFSGALTSLVLSPSFWLAPLTLAYYTLAYASFIALPLLIVDERLLWKGPERAERHSILFFWILGFFLALGIRLFWGLIYGPWVTQLFHLPPSP
jgi:hypothetical protein